MFGTSESASARLRPDVVARFWEKVCHEPNTGCWLWTGAWIRPYAFGRISEKGAWGSQGGYGRVSFGDGTIGYAHRFSYELHFGPITPGKQVDHLCRQHMCVNPAHMEAVSQRENMLRGESPAAKRAKRTHCPRGHEYTPENTALSARNQRHCKTCRAGRRAA